MPPTSYRRTRKFTRNRAAKKLQRWARRRRGPRAQAGQIVRISKRVSRLANKVSGEVNKWGLVHEVGSVTLSGFYPFQLVPAASAGPGGSLAWTNCFDASDAAANVNRVRIGNIKLVMRFTSFTEPQPISFTVIHCKLQPAQAQHMTTTFGTHLIGITSPQYYIRGSAGTLPYTAACNGEVMLNPTYFKTVQRWNFTLTNRQVGIGSAQSTVPSATYKRIETTLRTGYTLGDGFGSWRTKNADVDTKPEHKHYIFIFSDNLAADVEFPSCQLFAQSTVTALE